MQLKLTDLGTKSECGVYVERHGDDIHIGISIETNGDLDLLMSREDVARLSRALTDVLKGTK